MVDPSTSTLGNYTITYTTAGTCTNSSDIAIAITALDDATFNYTAASYCLGETTQTPTTVVPGGTFTVSPTIGLSIDPATGVIDPSTSTLGNYTVTYTTAGTCTNSSDVAIAITNLDDSTFNYTATSYCMSCLLYTSPSPRDGLLSRMPSSA